MYEYFFNFDKLFGENFGVEKKEGYVQKRRWYKYIDKDGKKILMYDVSGIDTDSVNVKFDNNGYQGTLTITGESETEFGKFAVNDRFTIAANSVGKESSYNIKNGILYIEIIPDKSNSFDLKIKK